MMGSKGALLKNVDISSVFSDDPAMSFIFIFGAEGSSTTTLALSIVDVIDEDKNVYILNTEPPHNETGIIHKHFGKEYEAGRFFLPTKKGTEQVIPITSRDEFYNFRDKALADKNIGAFVIDAIDTLRLQLFMDYSKNQKFGMKAWMDADKDIINMFMLLLEKQIPVIVITKEKEKTLVSNEGGGVSVEKVKDSSGNPLIVPTLDNERIQRWASIRLKTTKIGHYFVDKTKGLVEKGEKFKFSYDKETGSRSGVWLPQLLSAMTKE